MNTYCEFDIYFGTEITKTNVLYFRLMYERRKVFISYHFRYFTLKDYESLYDYLFKSF